MILDFTMLYVVVLVNSLLMAILWIIIYWAYENQRAAAIWSLASVTLVIGGMTLIGASFVDLDLLISLGNLLVVFAFSLFWAGIRRFETRPVSWLSIALLNVVTLALLVPLAFVDPDYSRRNIVFAVAQSAPLVASIIDLRRVEGRRVGRYITFAAMGFTVFVQALEAFGNILSLLGAIRRETYALIEPGAILAVVFSGVLWNYGLVLMVLDRIYSALQRKALHDDLTDLPNRRAFDQRLQAEIEAARHSDQPLSLLVVDLDGLKTLNDSYGHLAGDAGIAHVAQHAASRLRPGDMMARTGGDEFCILLPGARAEQAGAMAAAIVAAVREAPLRLPSGPICLTLSIGVAAWRSGQDGDALTAAADAALYRAKAAGRDGYALANHVEMREIPFRTGPAELRAN